MGWFGGMYWWWRRGSNGGLCCVVVDWVRMETGTSIDVAGRRAGVGLGGVAEEIGFTLQWYWSH